jgi:hypothetical protein
VDRPTACKGVTTLTPAPSVRPRRHQLGTRIGLIQGYRPLHYIGRSSQAAQPWDLHRYPRTTSYLPAVVLVAGAVCGCERFVEDRNPRLRAEIPAVASLQR